MDRGSRSARPLTGRAGADRTRTGGRGQLRPRAGAIAAEPVWRGAEPELSNFISPPHRGHGAIGSAPALQAGGYGFESRWLHHLFPILPLFFHRASPSDPLRLPSGSPLPLCPPSGLFFPLCPPPGGSSSPMPSAGGPPPICAFVRAVRLSASSLWDAAVGGEARSLAGDSAHCTGAARAARPGRLRSAGAAPLGRGGSARAGDAGASTTPFFHPAESSRRIVRRADAVGVLLRGEPSYDQGAALPEPSRTGR